MCDQLKDFNCEKRNLNLFWAMNGTDEKDFVQKKYFNRKTLKFGIIRFPVLDVSNFFISA